MEFVSPKILKDFGNGLIMRCSTEEDAGRLADFNGRIHGEDSYDSAAVAAWTRDLLVKPHPTFQKGDYVIVEDTNTGEIVSSMNTISQTWAYEGIPFPVGRPELVGTDPKYRNRGLVRAQFDAVHEISRQRGELIQVITGIPYFYRQFGYEMALELGGGRAGFEPNVARLDEGKEEPYCLRLAVEEDIPFLLQMMERERARSMVSAIWDAELLRHELLEKSRENVNRVELRVIEDREHRPVGYLAHPWFTWWGSSVSLVAVRYELAENVSYMAVTPSVIRYLWSAGEQYAVERQRKLNGFGFWLGSEHPAYQVARSRLPFERKPYAFYVRVADLPGFLRRIAPALETRLKQSPMAGYSGELKLSFYRDGLRMLFEQGILTTCERWDQREGKEAGAFPGLTFLQLVFGYRRLEEIRYAFVDCWAEDEPAVLLDILFPKKYSYVWAVS